MVLLNGFLDGFSKFWFFIVEICNLIRDFLVIFENYCMRMLSIRGNDFITHWAYEERISAHAQPAVKCELFYMCNLCWAYGERILSHTEHTRNEFHRMLSILGTDFIACWACAEMFKSRISLPIQKRFFKISCYRPLGPCGFGFCKKSQNKNFMLVYLNRGRVTQFPKISFILFRIYVQCTLYIVHYTYPVSHSSFYQLQYMFPQGHLRNQFYVLPLAYVSTSTCHSIRSLPHN